MEGGMTDDQDLYGRKMRDRDDVPVNRSGKPVDGGELLSRRSIGHGMSCIKLQHRWVLWCFRLDRISEDGLARVEASIQVSHVWEIHVYHRTEGSNSNMKVILHCQ